jgi:glycosyltransferase involved in cell wall biosynthesis
MRIGIDGRSLLETEPSGVSVYTAELIRAMAALPEVSTHHQLRVFVSGAHWPAERLTWLQQLPKTTVHHLRWPNKLYHAAALFGLARRIDQVCGGVDVLFAPNWHILPRRRGIPLVLTVHDLSYALYPQFLSWRRKLWHMAVRPTNVMRQAQRVIAVSRVTAQSLQQVGLQAPVVSVIRSAAPTLPAAEAVPGLPAHYIVCVGTLEPRKNLDTVLSAFQQHRSQHPHSQLHVVLLGARGWLSTTIQQQPQQNAFVHYLGYLTAGQKRTVIERAAALFYPSIYEGFGFPPLEALSVGTPVVASVSGALPEVLGRSAWYCNPYSTQELAELLACFDRQPRQPPPYYRPDWQRWSWQQTARATLQVLTQAVY